MSQIDIAEASNKLEELLEIALNGEEVIITQGEGLRRPSVRPVAKLVPVPEKSRTARSAKLSPRQFGSMRDIIWVADDFDEPLTEEFKEYM